MVFEKTWVSPVGNLRIQGSDSGLRAIIFPEHRVGKIKTEVDVSLDSKHPFLLRVEQELQEYFFEKRREFTLNLDFSGATEFQKKVWQSLLKIPYGQTVSYSEQTSKLLGWKETARRAVAQANSRNPFSIVVPCHRVIAANGALHGYGGGLHIKKALLELERS